MQPLHWLPMQAYHPCSVGLAHARPREPFTRDLLVWYRLVLAMNFTPKPSPLHPQEKKSTTMGGGTSLILNASMKTIMNDGQFSDRNTERRARRRWITRVRTESVHWCFLLLASYAYINDTRVLCENLWKRIFRLRLQISIYYHCLSCLKNQNGFQSGY